MRWQGKKLAQAARLWASGQLDTHQDARDDHDHETDALAIFGLVADAATDDDAADKPPANTFYLWPECVPLWGIWQRCQTLWRCGMNGRDGLDYAGLTAYLREVERIKPRAFVESFRCIQAMEIAALNEYAKQREKQQNSKA